MRQGCPGATAESTSRRETCPAGRSAASSGPRSGRRRRPTSTEPHTATKPCRRRALTRRPASSGAESALVYEERAGIQRLNEHAVRLHVGRLDMQEVGVGALGTLLDTVAPATGTGLDSSFQRNFESAFERCEVFHVDHGASLDEPQVIGSVVAPPDANEPV